MKKLEPAASWIWPDVPAKPNDLAVFHKTFSLDAVPETAPAVIAAETRYYLKINGQEAVFEGGLLRESLPGCGWADTVDLAPFLRTGENSLEILVYFWGNGGRNNVRLPQGGLLFSCPALKLASGADFLSCLHPGSYTPGEPKPAYLYGGDNLGLDVRKTPEAFRPSRILPGESFGDLYPRPIPQTRIQPERSAEALTPAEFGWKASLPYAMNLVPVLYVTAQGGETVEIRTDRWEVHGGPGDDHHVYHGHRMEFVCAPGENRLESILPLFGEALEIRAPQTVSVQKAAFRETGYDADFTGSFRCSDPIVNRLIEKAARTLYVCMRDNFMDCPDRERGQWIGDVSVQIPQVAFLMEPKAMLLAKKAIRDFISLRQGDRLVGNVPGEHAGELPMQSLTAISQWGLAAQYWKYTGDRETLATVLEPAVRYLQLWDLAPDGRIVSRGGNWAWYDHLYNCDGPVIENAWYLSALKFQRQTADVLNDHRFDEFLDARIRTVSAAFEQAFWKGDRYASDDAHVDDRANALAVLAGVCPRERYPQIRNVLMSVFNATVYMENFVLTALCEMGFIADAKNRMLSRYYNLAVNENSTLWEDFFRLGTRNHAWSGAPVTIAFRYFMGIDWDAPSGKLEVHPCPGLFDWMEATFQKDGKQLFYQTDGDTLL